MEVEVLKKIIKNKAQDHDRFRRTVTTSERYYQNANDVLLYEDPLNRNKFQKQGHEEKPTLHNADNRVSIPWHRLLVNQKASYTMATPPTFDVGDTHLNDEISKILGGQFGKVAKDLCISASNAGVAWLHVWKDESYQNFFRYSLVDAKQIMPIYSKRLGNELVGALRTYQDFDETGKSWTYYEYWNDKEVEVYRHESEKDIDEMVPSLQFEAIDIGTNESKEKVHTYQHDWGEVPFIPFRNSSDSFPDLHYYKSLIDVYDKVYSGFVNDLDDVQEIIFVLTNYGGQDKAEFLQDLKQFKMIQVDKTGTGADGGVDTLAVDIPTEARDKVLEITRELIFVQGQGVDPQRNITQNTSGVAIKHMYSSLEQKAGELETEFRQGFEKLIRFILKYSNSDPDIEINQTWKRTAINNDIEEAEKIAMLAPHSSKEAIARANPIVENPEDELAALAKELHDDINAVDSYRPEVEDHE